MPPGNEAFYGLLSESSGAIREIKITQSISITISNVRIYIFVQQNSFIADKIIMLINNEHK